MAHYWKLGLTSDDVRTVIETFIGRGWERTDYTETSKFKMYLDKLSNFSNRTSYVDSNNGC